MEDNGYDIEYKQEFLRNEILDPGYDPNVFLEFLVSKKGENGSDLNLWDMNELYVVRTYVYYVYRSLKSLNNCTNNKNNNKVHMKNKITTTIMIIIITTTTLKTLINKIKNLYQK